MEQGEETVPATGGNRIAIRAKKMSLVHIVSTSFSAEIPRIIWNEESQDNSMALWTSSM